MNKKFGVLLIVSVLATLTTWAQKPVITFDEKTFDFGTINETDGKATHVFEFTNSVNATLLVQRVNASCGCTTPEWTQTPVEPGKKGEITVTYNPAGRPGAFTKTITVYSNASNEVESLLIKGTVNSASSPAVNNYPIQIGDLKVKTKTVLLNNVSKGSTKTNTLLIQNGSKSKMTVSLADLPVYLKAEAKPAVLNPNEEGRIEFTFDSKKCAEWGPVFDNIYLVLDGKKVADELHKITVNANVVDDFSKMTIEEKQQSPILEIKSPNLLFGSIKQGSKVRGQAIIKNNGQKPLEIRRVINNNSNVTVNPMHLSIKGGKTGELKIDIDTKTLPQGDYKKSFTIQTNDPENSFLIYTLSWTVKK